MSRRLLVSAFLVVAFTVPSLAQAPIVAHRVFATAQGGFADLAAMVDDLATADVVFVGEQHNDDNTHRFQLNLLQALAARRGDIVLALEMFERDAQEPLEHFLMGHTEEAEFVRESRAWPRYATDYKPLVDFAISKTWPVVAANVPRAIAAEVSKSGLDALASRPASEKALFAADLQCPTGDDYYTRFLGAMGGGHVAGAPAMDAATLDRYYFSQCLKDETMGESVAQSYAAGAIGGKRPLIVVVLGAFHSDFRQGTVIRTARRLPAQRIVVTSILPVDTLDGLTPSPEASRRGDYLVYTKK
jgi:hypothetical protein